MIRRNCVKCQRLQSTAGYYGSEKGKEEIADGVQRAFGTVAKLEFQPISMALTLLDVKWMKKINREGGEEKTMQDQLR